MEMLICKIGMACLQSVLYEIIADLRAAGNNAASSSSAPPGIPLSSGKISENYMIYCHLQLSFSKLRNTSLF